MKPRHLERKVCFTLMLLCFLLGCKTTATYDEMLDSWVGQSEHQLLADWGRPSALKMNADGSEVWTYTKADNMYVVSEWYLYRNPDKSDTYAPFDKEYDFTPYQETIGVYPEAVCQTSFLVQNEKIIGWNRIGNDCISE